MKTPLERIARESKLGVVIRIPENYERRLDLGIWLVDAPDDGPDARDLYADVILICLRPGAYAALFPAGARSDATLIDEKVRVLASAEFGEGEKLRDVLLEKLRDLIHGPNKARLRAREVEARKRATPAQIEAMRRLNHDDVALIVANTPTLMPWIVMSRLETDDVERREKLGGIVVSHVLAETGWNEGRRLPYGISVKADEGCIPRYEEPDDRGRVAWAMCGMAGMGSGARMFARYLCPPEK